MDEIKNYLDAYVPFLLGLSIVHFGMDYKVTFGLVITRLLGNLTYVVFKQFIIRNARKT